MIKQLIITILFFTSLTLAQNYGSMHFTNYPDARKSAFSFTFDDGLLTHYENARSILNQYGFKGTFYLIPTQLTETLPGIWRYGTWPQFQEMSVEGHEIGSHTMNHDTLPNLEWGSISTPGTLLYELYQSKVAIEQKIPAKKCISLNYPYTLRNSEVDSAASLFYENGRAQGEDANDSTLFNKEWYSLKAKIVEFNFPRNSVSDDLDELYSFLDWAQTSVINTHGWGMIIIHDVIPFSELNDLLGSVYQPVTNEWFTSLCEWLWVRSRDKEVWVATVGDADRYIKERESAEYQVVNSTSQLIEINVYDNLNNTIYNYPLSAYIDIPDNWQYVVTNQSGKIDTLSTIVTDSRRVVLAKVIPDSGTLKITPVIPASVDDDINTLADLRLFQNYPNPFNPTTIIQYTMSSRQFVTLKVYDLLGNEVATLINNYQESGNYEVEFDPGSSVNHPASGVYYYQLRAGNFIGTKKMIYLK